MTTSTPFVARHVRLRPPDPEFIDVLYELAMTRQVPWTWRTAQQTPDSFGESLWRDVLVQHAIEDRRTGQAVGLVTAYDANLFHGYAYASLVLLPDFRFRVWPLEGALLFANYLFVHYGLRHLYAKSAEESFLQFRSGAGTLYEVEGCLRGHLMVDGQPQDQYLLSISRQRWSEHAPDLLRHCVAADEAASPDEAATVAG